MWEIRVARCPFLDSAVQERTTTKHLPCWFAPLSRAIRRSNLSEVALAKLDRSGTINGICPEIWRGVSPVWGWLHQLNVQSASRTSANAPSPGDNRIFS